MERPISKNDVLMAGGALAGLEYGVIDSLSERGVSDGDYLDVDAMLEHLRQNPDKGVELLSYPGHIVYMGASADRRTGEGRTLGVRMIEDKFVGDNVYGRFLDSVRDAYARELRERQIEQEVLVRPGQVVVDFTPDGSSQTDVEIQEEMGREFIHTEPYLPSKNARRVFDVGRDGTSGHGSRKSDRDVAFHTFENPFGLTYRYKVQVETAAEASFLYERGLRGELDFKSLFADLRSRNLVQNLTPSEEDRLSNDLRAQFAWMREEISRNESLKDMPVVTDTLLVPDASFGRSVFDADLAPCAAHILARYINNPELLYCASENGVTRAFEQNDKNEGYRFSAVSGGGTVVICVDGSDTIGGRVPGTRVVQQSTRVLKTDRNGKPIYDADGNRMYEYRALPKFQFKAPDEVESDYAAFSQRLNDVISNISPDVHVRFVTSRKVGTAQMVKRFVEENGGKMFEWDFSENRMKEVVSKDKSGAAVSERFSAVQMPEFDRVFPVLVGAQSEMTFNLVENDDDTAVTFRREMLPVSGMVDFSVRRDRNNYSLLQKGSLASVAGLPVVHVQENRTEQEQQVFLSSESSLVKDRFIGEQTFTDTVFSGEARDSWDLSAMSEMGYVDRIEGVAIPAVAYIQEASVYVNNVAYHSVYSAYAALVMKESGVTDKAAYLSLASNENSIQTVSELAARYSVSDAQMEKCLRNAVHMMAHASAAFSDSLLGTGDAPIAAVSTYGDSRLFVNLDGRGENRFGIVLEAERRLIGNALEIERRKSEAEAKLMAEENARSLKRANTVRARGEKMTGGLPAGVEQSKDAVWFMGTHRPGQLVLTGDNSFYEWEESRNGSDSLCREIASRAMIDDGEGNMIENRLVFFSPSDLLAVSGKRHVVNNPDSRDLTGVKRVNPDTGREFVCAVGIPVKKDNYYYEFDNKFGRSCSFLTDHDSASFANNLVNADTLGRLIAIEQNMSLCYGVRPNTLPLFDEKLKGTPLESYLRENDDISRVFVPKVWDYVRTRETLDRNTGKVTEGGMILPTEVKRRYYNEETGKYETVRKTVAQKSWVANPHGAEHLRMIVKRHHRMLKEGAKYPLNCIPLASCDYSEVSQEQFLADLNFALNVTNSLAVALDKPMRFPLDRDGRIDLGPDVPEKFREIAERRIDSFINVVKEESLESGIRHIERVNVLNSADRSELYRGTSQVVYMHPSDLMRAFGPYDFRAVERGGMVPVHEMVFRADDGTLFRVNSERYTGRGNLSVGEIGKYLRYERNDELKFYVRSTDPDRIPAFINTLKSYLEVARKMEVETRLLTEDEARGMNLDNNAFFHLAASNSGELLPTADALNVPNRFDGTADVGEYYGKVDSRDGFDGYPQFRYTKPDGSQSEWICITDRKLQNYLTRSMVNRTYSFMDGKEWVPSKHVVGMMMTSLAMKEAGSLDSFEPLKMGASQVKVDDKVVQSERYEPEQGPRQQAAVETVDEKKGGRVFVTYYGSRSVPDDAFKVRLSTSCPKGMEDEMDVNFESLYPDYRTMVGPYKDGKIDQAEYTRRYSEKVLEPNREKILSSIKSVVEEARGEGTDVYMYCYCKPGDFCHRYLVNNFLNENGIACQENPADRRKYVKGQVPLYGEDRAGTEYAKDVRYGYYTGRIEPADGVVMVFGSNPEGRHGAGAAKVAKEKFGAVYGQGEGLMGNSYALPTKDLRVKENGGERSISEEDIMAGIRKMYQCAKDNPDRRFMVAYTNGADEKTLNGYTGQEMAGMFYRADEGNIPGNVVFSDNWKSMMESFERGIESSVQEKTDRVIFTQSSGSYARRTHENANAEDVDFTFQFCHPGELDTPGERCTAKAAGDSLITIELPFDKDDSFRLTSASVKAMAAQIVDNLPEEFVKGDTFGVNLAGNGISHLHGLSQETLDVALVAVAKELSDRGINIVSWRSGGQTGVDESVAAIGNCLDVPVIVHAPANFSFRGVSGKDVKNDEQAFKERFAKKDYDSIRAKAEKLLARKNVKSMSQGLSK